MTVLSRDRLVEAANALPPLPDSFVQLQQLFSDPEYSSRDVVQVVELDPVLAGRAIRLANSAAYGLVNINTTQQAVARLGAATITALAIIGSAQPPANLDLSAFGLTPRSYWKHSVTVLAFAEELIAGRFHNFGNELMTAALLHDFGKLLLAPEMDQEQVRQMSKMDRQLSAVEREEIVLGVNHAEITAIIAESWGLSERLIHAVKYHHNPENFEDPVCHGLNIANQLAWRHEGRHRDLEREARSLAASRKAIGIDDVQYKELFDTGSSRLLQILECYS